MGLVGIGVGDAEWLGWLIASRIALKFARAIIEIFEN